MLRTTLVTVFVLLLVCGPGRADDQPQPAAAAVPAPSRHPTPSKSRRVRSKSASRTSTDARGPKPTGVGPDQDILRPGEPAKPHDPHPAADARGWSVVPKWSAANGGSSAAYGTRALLNELQVNPAEVTGYGGGAELDFHF